MSPWQAAEPAIVLASGSAARRAVLEAACIAFTVQVAAVDEAAIKQAAKADSLSAVDAAILLAEMKAQRVARVRPQALVIGCDQLLVCGDTWFDKPASIAEARVQLQSLRGKRHRLVTAMVCFRDGQRIWHHVAEPRMSMRNMSDRFLDAYLAAEGPAVMGSVGAYRLEGLGIHLFDEVVGEYAAILGLPVMALLGFLRQQGVLEA